MDITAYQTAFAHSKRVPWYALSCACNHIVMIRMYVWLGRWVCLAAMRWHWGETCGKCNRIYWLMSTLGGKIQNFHVVFLPAGCAMSCESLSVLHQDNENYIPLWFFCKTSLWGFFHSTTYSDGSLTPLRNWSDLWQFDPLVPVGFVLAADSGCLCLGLGSSYISAYCALLREINGSVNRCRWICS